MRQMEETILNTFRNNAGKDLNTEFLAKEAYPRDYSIAEDLIKSSDKINSNNGKDKKFQLHRKTLYYLNKLVETNILKVSKIADKGEKYFTLIASEGDTIFEKGYRKIIITKPTITNTYLEQYESRGVMKKYEEQSWINRFNSIMLECSVTSEINRLYNIMIECFTNVNDAVALNEFEILINNSNELMLKDFLEKTSREADTYGKNISLIINISQVINGLNQFIDNYIKINPKNVNLIWNVSSRDIQKYSKNILNIFEKFSENKIKINIKNSDLTKSPLFKGRAGIYTFDEHDWEIYFKKFKGKSIGLSCSQSQIAINVNKFFEEYKTDVEFRKAVINAAKTLLLSSNIQRRKSTEYFRNISSINISGDNKQEFYKFSRNYIRFWNYDWHRATKGDDTFFELLKSSKELVHNFCRNEETIFKSCGIPMRFKIAFSSAFKNFDKNFTGERGYKKINVSKIEDYYSGEMKTFLQYREKMSEVFDGGDRVRIFRSHNYSPNDILHELGILLNAYRIPLFTYDFSGLKGMVKLTNFIEN